MRDDVTDYEPADDMVVDTQREEALDELASAAQAQDLEPVDLVGPGEPAMVYPPDPTPVYGGEQQVSGGPRQLVVIQPLADRSAMSHKERIVILESDIREAMALAARRLNDAAMKYSVTGYRWDLDDIVYEHGGHRVITATLRIERPA